MKHLKPDQEYLINVRLCECNYFFCMTIITISCIHIRYELHVCVFILKVYE